MTHLRARAKPVLTATGATALVRDGFLQRKCACGKGAGLTDECEECQDRKFLGNSSPPLQKKLAIDEPGDPYEREADRVAEQITNSEVACKTPRAILNIARVQRWPVSPAAKTDVPPIVHEVLSSPGQPLAQDTRAFFEPRLGHDFSRVRVHADSKATESAKAVGALAYTVAPHIVFSSDHFAPSSPTGRSLIAHELTHIVQQGSPVAPAESTASSPAMQSGAQRAVSGVAPASPTWGMAGFPRPRLQRQVAPPTPELSSWEEGLIEAAAAVSTFGMGETARSMVTATMRGFALEVKAQAPTKGPQLSNKVEELITSPSEAASFVLHYEWGLVKGLFSPLTGLVDLAALGLKMPLIQLQILATTWTRREQLANEARTVGEGLQTVGARVGDAVAGFISSPIDTLTALEPWFASMQKNAEATAESAGHSIGNVLMSQLDRPLPELGEIAGETAGSAFINLVLFIFTDGIGDAISLAAAKLGELGAALGKLGETAQMLGALAGEIGELLGTVGAWVTEAEAAFAAAAETVLKPIAPLLKEVGKLLEDLRSFLRDLLGVTEGTAGSAAEKAAATAGRTVGSHPTPRTAELTTAPPPSTVSEPLPVIEPLPSERPKTPALTEPSRGAKSEVAPGLRPDNDVERGTETLGIEPREPGEIGEPSPHFEEPSVAEDASPVSVSERDESVRKSSRMESDQLDDSQLQNELGYLDDHPENVEGEPSDRRASIGDHEWEEEPQGWCRHSRQERCVRRREDRYGSGQQIGLSKAEIDELRRQMIRRPKITAADLEYDPVHRGAQTHGVDDLIVLETVNDPQAILVSANGNWVFYRDGTIVITRAQRPEYVFTAFGRGGKIPRRHSPNLDAIFGDYPVRPAADPSPRLNVPEEWERHLGGIDRPEQPAPDIDLTPYEERPEPLVRESPEEARLPRRTYPEAKLDVGDLEPPVRLQPYIASQKGDRRVVQIWP
jgi:hypothetical protein